MKDSPRDDTIKLIKVGGPALAQIDNPENGPSFGKFCSGHIFASLNLIYRT